MYAIPSLPLLIVLPLVIGTTVRSSINVVVALTLYGIALMVRSVADSLAAVPATRSPRQPRWASPAGPLPRRRTAAGGPGLLAGLRVVAVSTVALVTVMPCCVHSLGCCSPTASARHHRRVVTGIVGTVVLAVVIDRSLVAAGWLLMPWLRARPRPVNEGAA